jgi:DNA-directed RNA polymerase specialized sigma24 family protein
MDKALGLRVPASDAELLNTIRSGDPGADALLRRRHAAAARRLAGQLASGPAAADDLVASVFTCVLDAIRRGGGPTDAFRPYLLTAVRRAARGSFSGDRAEIPADEQQIPDPGQPFDPAAAGQDAAPLVAAFMSLPERWRAVLWHAEIEQAAPSKVAPLLGLDARGVTELAARAREGLRQAYLQPQATGTGSEHGGIAGIGAALRSSVALLVLGDAAAAYLARPGGSPGVPASLPVSAGAGKTALRDTTAGTAVTWLPGKLRRSSPSSPRRRVLAAGALLAGALLAIFGIAAYVVTLSAGGGPATASGSHPAAAALGAPTLPATAAAPARRPAGLPAARNRDSSSRRPPEAAAPGASPTPAKPAEQLAERPQAHPLAAPPNPVLMTGWRVPGAGGWNCLPAAGGPACARMPTAAARSGSFRAGGGTPGRPGPSGRWPTRQWPAWHAPASQWPASHAPPWQAPPWQYPAWHAPVSQYPAVPAPPWPGQGAHGRWP